MALITFIIEQRSTVDTATAAHHLNYSIQTLLCWASRETEPLQQMHLECARKLPWQLAAICKLVGVTA